MKPTPEQARKQLLEEIKCLPKEITIFREALQMGADALALKRAGEISEMPVEVKERRQRKLAEAGKSDRKKG